MHHRHDCAKNRKRYKQKITKLGQPSKRLKRVLNRAKMLEIFTGIVEEIENEATTRTQSQEEHKD